MFASPSVDNNGQPLTIREAEDFNEKILRDWFAGQMLASGLINDEPSDENLAILGLSNEASPEEIVSAIAYRFADTMLASRQRKAGA